VTVLCETDAPVVRIFIYRPEVANAVDRPTAAALADRFRDFDANTNSADHPAR
jgi:enoyl-CoA hydratase